jgi:hypothetical protein
VDTSPRKDPSAPFQPRPGRVTPRRPILRFVLRQDNVLLRTGPGASMTYDNPVDVNRGPLDLRQGYRHKYVLEFFPLDLLAFTAIMAAGLASRWPPPTIEASLHRGNSDCKLATAQNMT